MSYYKGNNMANSAGSKSHEFIRVVDVNGFLCKNSSPNWQRLCICGFYIVLCVVARGMSSMVPW